VKLTTNIIHIDKQDKLLLVVGNSFRIVAFEDINYLQSWGSYTQIYLSNNKKIVSTMGITFYEELLVEYHFFKINKSTLINLNEIESYNHKKKSIKLQNTQELEVSRRKQKEFVKAVYELTIRVSVPKIETVEKV